MNFARLGELAEQTNLVMVDIAVNAKIDWPITLKISDYISWKIHELIASRVAAEPKDINPDGGAMEALRITEATLEVLYRLKDGDDKAFDAISEGAIQLAKELGVNNEGVFEKIKTLTELTRENILLLEIDLFETAAKARRKELELK